MEINPLSPSFQPPEGRRKQSSNTNAPQTSPQTDSYVGPNTEEKINKLQDLDASRPDLIEKVKKEISDGSFLNEERIKGTIENLLNHL
jgi:anti-sigma28 factor (negative regulator of flagellin synthesis)